MKKTVLIVMLAGITLLLAGQVAVAAEAGDFAIGVRATYNMIQDDELTLFSKMDTEFDGAFGGSVDFTYFLTKEFSLELGIGYLKTDMDVKYADGSKEGYAELTQVPVQLTGRYHFAVGDKAFPYLGLGVGYYFNDMDNADGPGDFFYGAPAGVDATVDDAFGFHVAAGVEYFVTENVALNLDLKYIWMKTDVGFDDYPGEPDDSTRMDSFVTGLGVKYYF